ncbi:MAG TPA: amidohydrolase family protein [Pyrinomonadaceae bacterium]|nr:amidohydrolase family protein [Pyrinomonadaceae bacterium]
MKFRHVLFAFAAIGLLFSVSISAQTYAVTNARIVTVSDGTIENGTVVVRGGLIESVGANIKAPSDAEMIDGTGMTVYPGFIDALTSLGLQTNSQQRGGGVSGPQASPETNSNYPDGLRPEEAASDELKAGETQFEANRNAGFTTVVTVGRTGIFNGESAVIDLAGDSVSAMIIKSPFAEHISFNTIRGQYPVSLLGTFSALRQMMLDAQRLQEIQKLYAANPRGIKRPESDKSLEALIPVINRQIPVVFNANSEREIVRALDLAKEFSLRAIIAGGQESWKVADRLKAQNVPVLLSLNFPKRTTAASADADPEPIEILRLRAETPKGPARLAQAGVKFAFQSDSVKNIGDFFTNAGKAVENGLNRDAAIRAMTLGSAEILGVNAQTGSIEPGKIANLVVVKGDLFGKDRAVKQVFVDGKLFEVKEQPKPTATPANGGRELPSVAGNYNITIDIPGQPLPGTLAFTQQGNLLTGTIQSSLGTAPIRDGKVTVEGFSFSATVEYGGSTVDIIVKGTVTGNQVSGTIDSPQGAVPFSGTKNP